MKPLYTKEEFELAKSNDELLLECYYCDKPFNRKKKEIQSSIKRNRTPKTCSLECNNLHRKTSEQVKCSNCNKEFEKTKSQIKKSKSGNHFCSNSCSATYNNTHKKHGTRVSKLEKWLAEQLTMLYPDLEILYNRKDAINSELDIYIPSLRLAFELNGLFHYEPIYGQDKLEQIQNNDNRKYQACLENGIELCWIDTSQQTYVKPKTSQKYLDIITNIIDMKNNNSKNNINILA